MSQTGSECIAQATYSTVHSAVLKLAASCEECGEPILYLCLEQCCSAEPTFCFSCQRSNHLLHQTNEISALLVSRKSIEDPDSYSKKLLMTTLNALTNAKKATERLITKAQSIASHYVRSITEIQAILVTFDNDCWYDRFSSIVEEYILHRTDLKKARKIFSEMAPKINIYRDKIPSLQSTVYRLKDLNT